jgi:CBS domain-containing protein
MQQQLVGAVLADKGSQVHTIAPGATVADAVARMNELRIGALLVIDNGRPVGIFTERDVLVRVVAERRDPASTGVVEVMTRRLVSIAPTTTVEDAMVIVTESRCRHLPVIDAGTLCGLVSIGDLTRWVVRDQQHRIADLVGYITNG